MIGNDMMSLVAEIVGVHAAWADPSVDGAWSTAPFEAEALEHDLRAAARASVDSDGESVVEALLMVTAVLSAMAAECPAAWSEFVASSLGDIEP